MKWPRKSFAIFITTRPATASGRSATAPGTQATAPGRQSSRQRANQNDQNDDSSDDELYIPLGPGNPNYEDSDDEDIAQNLNPFDDVNNRSDTCTAFWLPRQQKQIHQFIVDADQNDQKCVICLNHTRQNENRHYLTLDNLWTLVEYTDLHILQSKEEQYVCTGIVGCIGMDNKISANAKRCMNQQGKDFYFEKKIGYRFDSRFKDSLPVMKSHKIDLFNLSILTIFGRTRILGRHRWKFSKF